MSVSRAAGQMGSQSVVSIARAAALDDRLSYAARGLLLDLMSRPDEFQASADALSQAARAARGDALGEGRRAMRALFAELEKVGYLRRERSRTLNGQFFTVLTVTDRPDSGDASVERLPAVPEPDARGVVYVIGDGRANIVKIGVTQNLKSRLKSMQVSYPYRLLVLCVFHGGGSLEAHLHQRFHSQRLEGEWFDFGEQDPVSLVTEAADAYTSP